MAGGLVGPSFRRYRAKSWKKTYTVNDQPRKLEIGTPKYPRPCVQIHVWLMVEAIGSRERSQATIMNDATNGTATVVKIVEPRRTPPKIRLIEPRQGSRMRCRMEISESVRGRL